MNRTLIALALLLAACSRRADTQEMSQPEPSHETLPANSAAPGQRLYDLELALTDQRGNSVGLDTFAGHPVIVSMFYGTCPYACPMLISEIKGIEKKLPVETRSDLRVLLVSFDPERDTTAKLAELARGHDVDEARWTFARASADDVRELAAVLGIKYRKLANGAFNHSTVITVLDRGGRISKSETGLDGDHGAVRTAIERLASGSAS